MSETTEIIKQILIVRTPTTFEELQTNSGFTYDPNGTELLVKVNKSKAFHLGQEQPESVQVNPETVVYQIIF